MPKRGKRSKRNAENDDHAEEREENYEDVTERIQMIKEKIRYYLSANGTICVSCFKFLFLARRLGSCSLF